MSARAARRAAARPHVLVVDDDPDYQVIARRELGPRFRVVSTASAGEALERLRGAERFDLIVLDYRLGDMNALAFLRAATGDAATCPPVIVVSGRDDARVAAAARELGAFAFLAKESFAGGGLASLASAALGLGPDGAVPRPEQRSPQPDVLARMSEGLYAVDDDGVIVLANRAVERLLGYGPRELLGLGLERVMGLDALGDVAGCLSRGEAFVETELVDRAGKPVPVLVSPTPLLDPGGHLAVVRDFRDLRDRIGNLEQANRKLRDRLVEVAVQVLHNVGNAVASLDVRAEDLSREVEAEGEALRVLGRATDALLPAVAPETADPARAGELVELARDAARTLDGTRSGRARAVTAIRRGIDHVARAIEYARSFAGRTRALEPDLDLRRACDTACELVKDIARGRGLDVAIDCRIGPDAPLLAIPEAAFEQLVVNLLKNAVESVAERAATDPGAPRRVALDARIAEGKLVLEVQDTGQGAPPEVAARVFEFGFTTKPEGSGFGLHASAEFVERLGGRIALTSPGRDLGATVRVEIPLTPPAEPGRDVVQEAA